jgi:hypothetical protein
METMGAMPMHADEIEIPESSVRSLVSVQTTWWPKAESFALGAAGP